jgi:type I restriction-modification system DNA methylase subunit
MARPKSNGTNTSTVTIGFEAKLWRTADKLRNNMGAVEYKQVVLGLSTQIPACLWFFWKNEHAGKCRGVAELELALAA